MTSAVERFKMLLSNALERVCILEEQLEVAQTRLTEIESQQNGTADVDINELVEAGGHDE